MEKGLLKEYFLLGQNGPGTNVPFRTLSCGFSALVLFFSQAGVNQVQIKILFKSGTSSQVGLVSCQYRLRNASTTYSRSKGSARNVSDLDKINNKDIAGV